jgi:hypothetical protein
MNYSLGKASLSGALENILWFASPFTWVDLIVEFLALAWELIRDLFF